MGRFWIKSKIEEFVRIQIEFKSEIYLPTNGKLNDPEKKNEEKNHRAKTLVAPALADIANGIADISNLKKEVALHYKLINNIKYSVLAY